MYENLKIKMMTKRIARDYNLSEEERILAFISLMEFENEPKLVKKYIAEFAPDVWAEFNTIDEMAKMEKRLNKILDNKKDIRVEVRGDDVLTLDSILKKIRKEK